MVLLFCKAHLIKLSVFSLGKFFTQIYLLFEILVQVLDLRINDSILEFPKNEFLEFTVQKVAITILKTGPLVLSL